MSGKNGGNGAAVEPRIACIFLPLWPVQRLVAARPELRGGCVILFRQDARRGQVVHAASPRAGRMGVGRGMPLAEARALVRPARQHGASPSTGGGIIRAADPAGDREALRELAIELQQFSPLVGLEQADDPHALLLDLRGVTHLFGGEAGWCAAVQRWLAARGWHARIAVARTIGAAWAAACYGGDGFGSEVRIVDGGEGAGEGLAALDSLPVEALRIEPAVCGLLAAVGVRTIGQLRRLPRAGLAARFGDGVARRLDQMDGRLAEVLVGVTPPEWFTASMPLEYPLADRETLGLVIQRLVSRTAAALAARQQGALRWRVALARQQAGELALDISLFAPAVDADNLRQLVAMHLEQRRDIQTARHPVTAVTVTALECVRLAERQAGLFAVRARRDDPAALAMLVNRLAARLGPEQVVRPQVLAEHQPELAVRWYPLAGYRAPARAPRRVSEAATPRPLERPPWQFPQPLSVQVELDAEERPVRMVCGGESHRIARCQGPERIETGWWRGTLVRRDCWRVETAAARRFWLHHDLQRGTWLLWGAF